MLKKDKIVFEVKILNTCIGNITSSQIIPTARAIANIYKDFGQREDIKFSDFKSFLDEIELVNFYNIFVVLFLYRLQNHQVVLY